MRKVFFLNDDINAIINYFILDIDKAIILKSHTALLKKLLLFESNLKKRRIAPTQKKFFNKSIGLVYLEIAKNFDGIEDIKFKKFSKKGMPDEITNYSYFYIKNFAMQSQLI